MACLAIDLHRTASTTLSLGNVTADATRPRRTKWYEFNIGSEGTPADNIFLWVFQRCTTAGTATAVVPQPLDPANSATELDAAENHTIEPTYTAAAFMMQLPLNQRATFRWQANPNGEFITPATASNGIGVQTPTSTALAITAQLFVDEQ